MGNPASCSHNDWTAIVQQDGRAIYNCRRCSRSLGTWEILRSLQTRIEALEGVPDSGSTLFGRITGTEARLDILQVYLKEILITLRGDESLFIRTPHLREHINKLQAILDGQMKTGQLPSHADLLRPISWWDWLRGKF